MQEVIMVIVFIGVVMYFIDQIYTLVRVVGVLNRDLSNTHDANKQTRLRHRMITGRS